MTWAPIRMDESHVLRDLRVGEGGHLCQALILWLLDHVQILFGAAGAVRGSIETNHSFLSPIEVFQYINNQ